MKGWLLLLGLLVSQVCFGQLKYDANWVFGKNVGIDFSDAVSPFLYNPTCDILESAASISDKDGDLLFYVSNSGNPHFKPSLLDRFNQVLLGSDSFNHDFSATNGMVILPGLTDSSIFWIIHMIYDFSLPNCVVCNELHISKVYKHAVDSLELSIVNFKASTTFITEGMAVCKNADNSGWWIVTHEAYQCNNSFFVYLLTDSIRSIGHQGIGGINCYSERVAIGEMSFNLDGTKLAKVNNSDSTVEVFNFDRCTGMLSNPVTIDSNITNPYGCQFSPDGTKLYVSTIPDAFSSYSAIYQYELDDSNNLVNKATLWDNNSSQGNEMAGQMELLNKERIVVSVRETGSNLVSNNYLSTIDNPNNTGLQCDFRLRSLFIGDSAFLQLGLPHFPNFNLGPAGVFQAQAGPDTLQCDNGYGVTLGVPQVPNILYQWAPANTLNDATLAQPLASPEEDTWYYLTATDTTATSCAVNVDSVLVQVTTCTGIAARPMLYTQIYPNPAQGYMQVSLPQPAAPAYLQLYSVQGSIALQQAIPPSGRVDVTSLSAGIYLYHITHNGVSVRGKLVVE